MGRNMGYGGWWVSTVLLVVGLLSATAGITFGVMGGLDNADQPGAATLTSAGTAVALGGLVFVVAGGVLRYCSSCWDDCEWGDEEKLVQIQTAKTPASK